MIVNNFVDLGYNETALAAKNEARNLGRTRKLDWNQVLERCSNLDPFLPFQASCITALGNELG